jgi:hypothetical protein
MFRMGHPNKRGREGNCFRGGQATWDCGVGGAVLEYLYIIYTRYCPFLLHPSANHVKNNKKSVLGVATNFLHRSTLFNISMFFGQKRSFYLIKQGWPGWTEVEVKLLHPRHILVKII